MKDKNSLAHSAWNCKYHIVFVPKYRRMEIYGKIRKQRCTEKLRSKFSRRQIFTLLREHKYI